MHPTHCLISTQVRVKYGFIKVYAVGVYLCGNQIRAPHRCCLRSCVCAMAWRLTKDNLTHWLISTQVST